jgi:ABC-type dipeptide/oligopeptide/nickel transport system permease component
VLTYVLGRLAGGALAVVLVSAAVHALLALAPGDPLVALLGPAVATIPSVEQERLRAELGLDRPWTAQYAAYLGAALRGDLGTSRRSGRPVVAELRDRVPATAVLTGLAVPLAIVLGLGAGTAAAVWARTWVDVLVTGTVVLASAVPVYLSGLLLLVAFSLALGWLPASGSGNARHLVLPVLTLALASAAPLARMARGSLLDALAAPHVVVAVAKGLPRRAVVVRHALRNAWVPVLTVAGVDLGRMLSGAVFVEAVFGWPGVGRLTVDAIVARDLPLVQGIVVLGAVVVVALNLIVDLAYARLDPRVRFR